MSFDVDVEMSGRNDERIKRIVLEILFSPREHRLDLSGNGLWIEIYERV
jgi:hypothetical protein